MMRLKNIEKYAVQWLDYLGESTKSISLKLNIPEKDVVRCIEKSRLSNKKNNIKTGTSAAGSAQDKNLMLTQNVKQKKNRSKETEYSVKYLSEHKNMSISDISIDLGISEAVVESILSMPTEIKAHNVSKSQNLMIRQTANKKTNSVSIMTEGASQTNDELVKNFTPKNSRGASGAIFRPNE